MSNSKNRKELTINENSLKDVFKLVFFHCNRFPTYINITRPCMTV